MRHAVSLIVLTFAVTCLADAPPATQPYIYEHEQRDDPPMQVHAVTVDLTHPGVSIRVVPGGADPDGKGPWQTTLLPVRTIAEREGFDIAINGGFFGVKQQARLFGHTIKYPLNAWANCTGRAMTDGQMWSAGSPNANLAVTAEGKVLIGTFELLPPNTRQLIAGSSPQILHQGRTFGDDRQRHPRTGVGINADGTKLVFLIVDGRREGFSVGMTLGEFADEFRRRGCNNAINLDGGGSSTLVLRTPEGYRVMNRPSDGSTLEIPLSIERPVANALGITFPKPPTTAPGTP